MPCIDRNERARLLFRAEALDRRTRLPGQHGGVLKRSGLAVLKALLLQFANVATGRCDPSYDTLARVAGVCRSTLAKALNRLEAAGLLERVRRQCGTVRFSNVYVFPKSEFRPQTTTNKKPTLRRVIHSPRGLLGPGSSRGMTRRQGTNWEGIVQGPEVPMAVVLARVRAKLGHTHAVFARLRAEREARQAAPG